MQGKRWAHALFRARSFSIGQTTGRLAGALIGLFFLGAEGAPIGSVLGESLSGVFCYRNCRRPARATQRIRGRELMETMTSLRGG